MCVQTAIRFHWLGAELGVGEICASGKECTADEKDEHWISRFMMAVLFRSQPWQHNIAFYFGGVYS